MTATRATPVPPSHLKPAPRPIGSLDWALQIIARECDAGTYGTVTIHLQEGRIVRVQTEKNEVPSK
jgi:hypothetical protein